MYKVVSLTIPRMTKLRFVKVGENKFKRKEYIIKLQGSEAIQALRCRMNMIQIYGNYHNDITLRRLCPHCEMADDTTEHLLTCKVFHSTVSQKDLFDEQNIEVWKQILEIINFNLKHR